MDYVWCVLRWWFCGSVPFLSHTQDVDGSALTDSVPSAHGSHEDILRQLGRGGDKDEDKAAASSGSFRLLFCNVPALRPSSFMHGSLHR